MFVEYSEIRAIPKNDVLTVEEGYTLTKFYTSYFYEKGQFSSLKAKIELEDLAEEFFVKFLEKGYFDKYNSQITSKKYFVQLAVYRAMLDISVRKRDDKFTAIKDSVSMDIEDEDGFSISMVLPSKQNLEREVDSSLERERILELIPNDSLLDEVIDSPILGKCKMSLRVLALHLEAGFTAKEISVMFNVKSKVIHRFRHDLINYLVANVEI